MFLVAGVQWEETVVEGFQGKTSFLYTRVSLTLLGIRAPMGSLLKMLFSGPHAQRFLFSESGVGAGDLHHCSASQVILMQLVQRTILWKILVHDKVYRPLMLGIPFK